MIEIVKFAKSDNNIEIGYRLGKAVAYTIVDANMPDSEAKQKGYEQVKASLEYEQTLDKPSLTVDNMIDNENNAVAFEEFIPAPPALKTLTITGDREVTLEDGETNKEVLYEASATDQYGAPIDAIFNWVGAEDGRLIASHEEDSYIVGVEVGEVAEFIEVKVIQKGRSEIETINNSLIMLNTRNTALTQRVDFVEDIITEVVMEVYK